MHKNLHAELYNLTNTRWRS